jgi:hypothetical protein
VFVEIPETKLRADERAKRKEQARINDLKARFKRIDPNDEFFHPTPAPEPVVDMTGEEFGHISKS